VRVEVIPTAGEAVSDDLLQKTVIVIDVLRATSSMATAIEHGARRIIPAETVRQATRMRPEGGMLGGERNGKKIPGFDFGNSPIEYAGEFVRGATIVMSTSNGTRAIRKSLRAGRLLAGAILNASACARAALSFGKDVRIVCAGTGDRFCLEDGLGAGLILHEMLSLKSDLEVGDFGQAMRCAFLHVKDYLEEALFQCHNGIRLARLGFADDVRFCARPNVYKTVPFLEGDGLVAWRPAG